MTRPFIAFLTLLLPIFSNPCIAEFIGAYHGIQQLEQQYTQDAATSQEEANGIELNLQSYRHQPTGWVTRGPRIRIQQSLNHLDIDTHIPIYQFHIHQGLWFQFEWQENAFEAQLSSSQVYLDENGSARAIAAGSEVIFERSLQRGQVYWYESARQEGPINTAGLFYSVETSPTSVDISSTNASLFDGRFSGFGFSFGRIKDDKGLNFQWRLNLAQLNTNFSNNATDHRALSSLESTVYQVQLSLDWHYRYYLNPYWYVIPSFHYQYSNILQTQLQPEFVEHEPLRFTQVSGFIAIRRYF